MILIASKNKPDFPSKEVRGPATLNDWHGLPKQSTSTGGIFPPSSFVMSPKCPIPEKCRFVIDTEFGRISLAQSGVILKKEAA
jgi:hypothetical protein